MLLGVMLNSRAYADYTGPALKMPLPPGYRWHVTTKAGDSGDRYHQGTYYFSLDFGHNPKEAPPGVDLKEGEVDVLAAADGMATNVIKNGCTGTTACQVVLDHGGGYRTIYLHFASDTITVKDGDAVKQGQALGKMGTTGISTAVHLHFQIKHNDGMGTNDSSEGNNHLKGVKIEDILWANYEVGMPYYKSTNGFTFPDATDNPHSCSTAPTGSAATGWIYTCTKKSTFEVGDSVWGNGWITDVTKEFCVSAQLFKTGSKVPETTEAEWCSSGVEPWGWGRAYFTPWFGPMNEGNYEIQFRARLKMNHDYLPVPLAVAKITMQKAPPYKYDGNGMTCADQPIGSAATGWIYSCASPASTFPLAFSPTVYGLVGITDVKEDFKFITKVYKDGVLQWTDEPFAYQVVDKPFGWGRSYAAPQGKPWMVGAWKYEVYIQVKGYSPVLLKTLPFAVVL